MFLRPAKTSRPGVRSTEASQVRCLPRKYSKGTIVARVYDTTPAMDILGPQSSIEIKRQTRLRITAVLNIRIRPTKLIWPDA